MGTVCDCVVSWKRTKRTQRGFINVCYNGGSDFGCCWSTQSPIQKNYIKWYRGLRVHVGHPFSHSNELVKST